MKKSRFFIIAALLVVAAAAVAIVSCKKDTPSAMLDNKAGSQAFNPGHIDDMNGYLKDFKQKMQTAAKGDNESLTLEEAAWHLSSVANYDFSNANVGSSGVRFDTLTYSVAVTDGGIRLNDLGAVYEIINTDIDEFYHALSYENKHFRFIGCSISEQGEVCVTLITTFTQASRLHYFANDSIYDAYCDLYFSDDIQYYANSAAITVLTDLFNLFLGKNTDPNEGRIYYVITRLNVRYVYTQWLEDPDSYCPNSYHSRLYCSQGVDAWPIPQDHMCYYLDSYLGLGVDNITAAGPDVVSGYVEFAGATPPIDEETQPCWNNHVLYVSYGIGISGQAIYY